jgi:D-3-phosphoglycerate dehydrogenase
MSKFKVLLTDYAWSDLTIERQVLAEIDAELVVAPQHDEESLKGLAVDADAIMTCWAKVTGPVVEAARKCRLVARLGIGLDNIDVPCCTQRGIAVTNVPDYCVREVAEHALALMFSLARNVAFFHHETKQGRYNLQATRPPRRVQGQTVGVVGFGHIGHAVSKLAEGVGLNVVVHTRTPSADAECIDLPTLLQRSDFVSLHVPLTEQTRHLIGSRELAVMKPTAFLINTARGGLVDHAALAEALARNEIAGAGLDVQTPEPPDLAQAPYNDPRLIVTPHTAFVSVEAVEELRRRAATQVVARLSGGAPENVVNPETLL